MRPIEGPFMLRLLLAFLLLTMAVPAVALESAVVESKRATVSLVSDTDAIAPGTEFRVGLRFRLAEGWHTYWKNPGDAGVPPELTFALPDGATAGPIDWPAPSKVAEGPVTTYAYTGEMLLPVAIRANGAFTLKMHANWLVCKDICIPEEGDFSLALPVGTPGPNAAAGLFAAHDRAVPRPLPWAATIAAEGALLLRGPEARATADAWFVPDAGGQIVDSAPQVLAMRDDGFVLGLKLAAAFKPTEGLSGILTVLDVSGMRSDFLLHAPIGVVPPAGAPLGQALLFAFLGGLILNLMPCVFPILAMKAVGLATGFARGAARLHAVFYTAGVLVAFLGLAAALLAARSAGVAVGWGFQFQSPVFVVAMVWVLFAVGLNLSGVFQFGAGLMGVGGNLAGKSGHWGDFFTGLLAVLVATPCTAPFMGVAIAAGLSAPPPTTAAIFLAMGLGLATPYLLLAFVPGLGRRLPRPGRWMDVLKQALAFPMYAAAVWLLWVAAQQAGSPGVAIAAAGCVLLGFAAWVWGVGQVAVRPSNRKLAQALAVAAVLSALGLLTGIAVAPPAETTERGIEAFAPDRLAAAQAAGRPVFVNMTAAWCVTCLVNERVALRTEAVQQAFAARKVLYLKGDWTRQNPEITAFLRAHGRDGVPLYLFYPADGTAPTELPQILTEGIVLAALGPVR